MSIKLSILLLVSTHCEDILRKGRESGGRAQGRMGSIPSNFWDTRDCSDAVF